MAAAAERRRRLPASIAGVLLGLFTAGLWFLAAGAATADMERDPDAGRELFVSNCAACHGPTAQGTGSAPALAAVTERLGTEQVARTIREGRGGMPAFGARLDEAQIGHLVAHLEALPTDEVDGRDRSGGPMMHSRWRDMMGGWSLGVVLLWLVVALVALVVAGLALARWAGASRSQRGALGPISSPAREILDHRYARGEISRDEYLEARRDIEEPS